VAKISTTGHPLSGSTLRRFNLGLEGDGGCVQVGGVNRILSKKITESSTSCGIECCHAFDSDIDIPIDIGPTTKNEPFVPSYPSA
jgi:hypothetical protein